MSHTAVQIKRIQFLICGGLVLRASRVNACRLVQKRILMNWVCSYSDSMREKPDHPVLIGTFRRVFMLISLSG